MIQKTSSRWEGLEINYLILNVVANSPNEQGATTMDCSKEYHCSSKPYMISYWSFKLDAKYPKQG